MSAPVKKCEVTPLEALRRLYEVARKVDAAESGEFETLLQGELVVAESVLRDATDTSSEQDDIIRGPLRRQDGEYCMSLALTLGILKDDAGTIISAAANKGYINGFKDAAYSVQPDDPMDWPLPCDVKVGHGTHKKGVPLRSLVARMNVLFSMAQESQSGNAAAAAPVVPVAAQPVVPEGWRIIPKKTCYALVHGNVVVASLAGPDAEANAAIIANAIANIAPAAPSLEAQPAGEVERDAARYRWLCKTAFDSSMTQEQINKEVDASMAQGEKP